MTSSLGVLWGTMTGGPSLDPSVGNGGGGNYTSGTMTLSGGVITDAVRTAAVEGDGENPPAGIGIWPAATNLITNGGFETNATGWSSSGGTTNIARITSSAKFGTASGEITSVGSAFGNSRISIGALAAGTYTVSFYAEQGAQSGLDNNVVVTNNGGVDPLVQAFGALPVSWGQFSYQFTVTGTPGELFLAFYPRFGGGADGDQIRIDGVQVETGPIATPYVETDGGTASRVAGRVRQPVADLFTATQGWVCTAFAPGLAAADIQTGAYIFSYYDDDNNRLDAYYDTQPAIIFLRYAAGSGSTDGIVESAWDAGNILSIAAWTATAIKTSIGGNFTAGAANTNIPTIASTVVDIGTKAGVQFPIDGRILWQATGSGTLTNADAAALNALVDVVPTWAQIKGVLPATALLTGLYPAVDTSFQKVSA